jgi:hypothetical protein
MTTTNKSITLQDVLGAEVGAKFKISTDNDLYGTTVQKTESAIINVRTGEAMPLTAELVTSKFRPVSAEQELSLQAMLLAYEDGKKIKVVVEDRYRFVQKEEIPHEIKEFINSLPLPVKAFQENDVISFEELTQGKFYIAE